MQTKQILFTAPKKAELAAVELSPLKENEVLCRTIYSAVSQGTEKANILDLPNTPGGKFPRNPGYCAVSRVEATGKAVSSVKPGDRVLVYHGFHAELVKISESNVLKVEDAAIDDREAAFVIVAAMGLGGLRRLGLEAGQSAAVVGLGILGITALQFARLSGLCPLIAVDYNEIRRETALSLGADFALDPRDKDFVQKVKEITGGGANGVVEVTGSSSAFVTALDITVRAGGVSLLGCTRISDCPVDYYRQIHHPGITVYGAHNMARPAVDSHPRNWTMKDDMRAILRWLSYRRVSFLPFLSKTESPENCQAVYDEIISGKESSIGILFDWSNR